MRSLPPFKFFGNSWKIYKTTLKQLIFFNHYYCSAELFFSLFHSYKLELLTQIRLEMTKNMYIYEKRLSVKINIYTVPAASGLTLHNINFDVCSASTLSVRGLSLYVRF